jgi:hypothetical protein
MSHEIQQATAIIIYIKVMQVECGTKLGRARLCKSYVNKDAGQDQQICTTE